MTVARAYLALALFLTLLLAASILTA